MSVTTTSNDLKLPCIEECDGIKSADDSIGNISVNSDVNEEVKSLDNSENQSSDQIPGIKFNPLRRSSIFQKRLPAEESGSDNTPLFTGALDASLDGDSPILSQENVIISASPEERMLLTEYLKKLKEENEAWVTLRKERKLKYQEVFSLGPEILTFESCADVLSNENKKFIQEKPDYDALSRSVKELAEIAVISAAQKRSALHMSKAMAYGVAKRVKSLESAIANRD